MGGGDLNMKKSWHPVLLVNQERVWKAEKAANEDKKALAQLRKEREEERQLAELQRLQEAATGKKRVEKLDWMYAAPSNEGNVLGGARISETMMEDYLLGKRRVDDILAQADKNIGNTHKEFIAVQNANTARDTASKIREDPLLAIKKQEEAALKAMANRPDIRRQLRALKQDKDGESKEERKARKRAEKEDRRRERHERRERRGHLRSPRSDYSDERDRSSRGSRGERDDRDRRDRYRSKSSSPRRDRENKRDDSPRRRRDDRRSDRRDRDDSDRRYFKEERDGDSNGRDRREDGRDRREDDRRVPPPRDYSNGHGHLERDGYGRNGHSNGHTDVKPNLSRPGALDLADRPAQRSAPPSNGGHSLDEMRAARLAAMSSSATELQTLRTKSLAERAEEERREEEKDQRMRAKYGKEAAHATFFKQQSALGLSEALSRRGGQGLQRDI